MSTDPDIHTPDPTTTPAVTPTPAAPVPPHEPIVETATKSGPIPTPEPPAGYRWLIPGKDKLEATDMTWTGLRTVDGVLTRTLEPVFHAQAGATCTVFNTYLREITAPPDTGKPPEPGTREVRLVVKAEVTDASEARITELLGELNFARGMWRVWEAAAKDRAEQVSELEKASANEANAKAILTAENGILRTAKADLEREIASLREAKARVEEGFYKVADRLQIQTLHLTKLAHWMEMEEVRTSSMEYSSALAILNSILHTKDATANE